MNDLAMTNAQLDALQKLALAMGLQLDELNHPYREVPMVVEGEQIWRVVDFDPYNDPADAFRVQVHFGLNMEVCNYAVIVRRGMGPLLTIHELGRDISSDDRIKQCCVAVCDAALLHMRRENIEIDRRSNDG